MISNSDAGFFSLSDQFGIAPGLTYLDAATYGPAPNVTATAMQRALEAWRSGEADWIEDWDRAGDIARESFAKLIGAHPGEIALLPASSVGVALALTSLRHGDEVVVPAEEFTSVLFPVLVAARDRGLRVREVPFHELGRAVGPPTRLIAFSLVRMQSGEKAPLDEICFGAERSGAQVLVDATQALPFSDVRANLDRVDYMVCSAYKHLLCPRGAAFMYVRRDRWDVLSPTNANWRAADRPYGRYFGGPLTLAANAARFDVSLAWLVWVGVATSMQLMLRWRDDGVLRAAPLLSSDLASRLGLQHPSSTLVCVPVTDLEAARNVLRESAVRASIRGGAIRFSPHLYNTPAQVDNVARSIAPFVAPGQFPAESPSRRNERW